MRKICIVVSLLLLLPAVCGQTLGLRTPEFILYTDVYMTSWKNAQAFCRKQHTDLVTITSQIHNLNFLKTRGWIGLHREDNLSGWTWSRRDEITNFTIWESNNPNENQHCVFKHTDNIGWETDSCDATHSYLCYDETLVLVEESKTWEEALNHCRALEAVDPSKPATDYKNNRYDLATLVTPDDYIYTQEKAQDATTDEVWMGLRFLAGRWVWVGGEQVQNLNIKGCQTETSCGVLVKNGGSQIRIKDCTERKNFVCYRKR